ncbi:MFS transporter [Clostridium acetobutylicum]|uniref:MFS transporter n=1 Tax=Clostridium acetobutylicum TaxID=1488 RepID=UPI00098CA330|nr:MDR family MFS transporter [Clostridium acetobutylicum]OOL95573.1 antiseptic resistance protein [Clostridium acetobutylicum]
MNERKKYIGFIGILIAAFLGVIDSTIVNIALPNITDYFKVSLNDTSWISTIYALALAVFMITAAKFADQFGRKKLMIIGILIFGVSSALCGISNSLLFLIIMRFVQGIGGAIITPIALQMGIEIFGKERMNIVVGASGAVVGLAAASGPPLGGVLIKYINWQSVFFVNVPFAIAALILIVICVNESYDNTVSKDIDWFGVMTLTISLFCLIFALLKGKDYGWTSTLIISLFLIFVVSLILFIIIELKVSSPMIEINLFKEPTFTASSICYMITGFGLMCPLLILNYYLQNVLQYDTLEAAFIMMSVSLTGMFSTPIGSILGKKVSPRIINFIGMLSLGIGIFRLSYLSYGMSKGTMIFDLIICGIGLGFSVQALSSSVKFIPKEKSGIGSGIVNAARQIGSCIGIAILVSMLNSNVSDAKDNIKKDVVSYINNKKEIIYPVRKELVKIVNDKFNKSDNNLSNKSTMSQSSITNDVKEILKRNSSVFSNRASFEDNDTLEQLYNATKKLSDGSEKSYQGQVVLNNGIGALDSGINSIYNGSSALTSGMGSLNNGLNRAFLGSQKLKEGSAGLSTLVNGISQLNDGSKKLSAQFSHSQDENTPTIYDGIYGVNDGAQKLSSGVTTYVSSVDSTIYMMAKNTPNAANVLESYKAELIKAKAKNDIQSEEMLQNLIAIYSAAIDSSTTNLADFKNRLNENKNIVSSGEEVKQGAEKVSGGTSKVLGQFEDGGSFKTGVLALSEGIGKMSNSSSGLIKFQDGIGSLSDALYKLSRGGSKVYDGSEKLSSGIKASLAGGDKLKEGSGKILEASSKLKSGTNKIVESEGMAGQKESLSKVINKIKDEKNDKISEAFNKTNLIAAIVLMICSLLGLFTDKREKKVEA